MTALYTFPHLERFRNRNGLPNLAQATSFKELRSGDNLEKEHQEYFFLQDAVNQLDQFGLRASVSQYASLLRQCGNFMALSEGRHVHEHIKENMQDTNIFLGNLIVEMYGKCGNLDNAKNVFIGMPKRNVFTWTIMIGAYARTGDKRGALDLFRQMQEEGVPPDKFTFTTVLIICCCPLAFAQGKEIHAHIINRKYESDVVVGNALVNMYGKCRNIVNAKKVFDKMPFKNLVSWNSMIAAYSQNGLGKEGFHLFQQLLSKTMMPDKITFVSTLDACAILRSMAHGKLVHAIVFAKKYKVDVFVGNGLVNMYGKSGGPDDALVVFHRMSEFNIVSWNAIIAAYAQNCHGQQALLLFQQLQSLGGMADGITLVNTVSACANNRNLFQGRWVHAFVARSDIDFDVNLNNAMINMYGKCGSLQDALEMFYTMAERNAVSWSTIIGTHSQNGHSKEAKKLFQQMQDEDLASDEVTFLSVLDACANLPSLAYGLFVHAIIIHYSLEIDVVIGTAISNMYSKCGSLNNALINFNRMPELDVISWNAMVALYDYHGYAKEAVQLFQQLKLHKITPDKSTFNITLNACVSLESLPEGKMMHAHVLVNGFRSDLDFGNALIDMYGKCASLVDAYGILQRMNETDIVSWTAMIAACIRNEQGEEALLLFQQIQCQDLVPDEVAFVSALNACADFVMLEEGRQIHRKIASCGLERNRAVAIALVNMYGKCGSSGDAQLIFDQMILQDTIAWNVILASYCHNGHANKVLQIFQRMQMMGTKPDEVSFLIVLSACNQHAGFVDEAFQHLISMTLEHRVTPIIEHYGCAIKSIAQLRWIEEAEDILFVMPFQPRAISWESMVDWPSRI